MKATILLNPHRKLLDDRFSERKERAEHGRLRTQAEMEEAKLEDEAARKMIAAAAANGSEVA